MPNWTKNLNLRKPFQDEFYNIDEHNTNMDIIDEEIAKRAKLENGQISADVIPNIFVKNEIIGKPGGIPQLDDTGKLPADSFPVGVGGGKRITRYTVGTSVNGWTKNDCDYLCDGTADDVEINAAIQSLWSSGGEIVILDGTYNIAAEIALNRQCVTISGSGANTKLIRAFASDAMIAITAERCCIRNLYIDGVKGTYTDSTTVGIDVSTGGKYAVVEGNTVVNCVASAIRVKNSDCNIINNTLVSNGYGIRVFSGSDNVVMGNTCDDGGYGIYLAAAHKNSIVGNIVSGNGNNGISLNTGSAGNTVTGNVCEDNVNGINVANSENNSVSGNTCNNNSTYGIYVDSNATGNVISVNVCIGNASGKVKLDNADNIMYSETTHTHTADDVGAMHRKIAVVVVTASTTLNLTHAEITIVADSSNDITITIPTNTTAAFPVGTTINVCGRGTGKVTFVAASGVTLNARDDALIIDGQHAAVALYKSDIDTWDAWGALT